ncbi:hypothetical protein DSO57_1020018 [Entomophthora muscae]|uniref:Uncharacterized protein n=1 Tax=Entomophthora muscae TaxID=34485 RepID=A0ACC2UNQ0_9FUNG|nr:hypothetical protein DSO57_1020018 [Entomophthora muscae]
MEYALLADLSTGFQPKETPLPHNKVVEDLPPPSRKACDSRNILLMGLNTYLPQLSPHCVPLDICLSGHISPASDGVLVGLSPG